MKNKANIVVAILLLAVGFAAVSTTLIINGNAKIGENTEDFSVIFTKATLDGTDVYANVIDDTKKIITFETSDLKTLNQTSVLNYEVTNNSANYDAEVQVNCKVKDDAEAKYTSIKNELEGNATVVKAKNSVNGTLTVTLNKTATEEVKEEYVCELTFNAVERDTLGENIPDPESFATDSWKTIQKAVQTGNTSKYNVGDTKKVTIASHTNDCSSATGSGADYVCNSSVESEKEVTVRIANKSECTTETSETACGFVVEFVDIIENHNYNKADATNTSGTNVGGWRDSEIRTYINGTLYNSLPSELQSVMATTKVISGHGSTIGETNFESQDRLYLLSTKEVWGTAQDDTVDSETKQLDYYRNQGATISNPEGVEKQYDGSYEFWFLRSANSSYTMFFLSVNRAGYLQNALIHIAFGISPAFRIA